MMNRKLWSVTPFVVAAALFAGAVTMGPAIAGENCASKSACSGEKATKAMTQATCPVTGEAKAAMTQADQDVQIVPAVVTQTSSGCTDAKASKASTAKAGCESACASKAKATMTKAGSCGTKATATMAKAGSCGSAAKASMAKADCDKSKCDDKSSCDGAKASMTMAKADCDKSKCDDKSSCDGAKASMTMAKADCDKSKCDDKAACDKTKASKYTQAARAPEVILVKFHADYCKSCVELEPTLTELKETYKDKAALFVTFDLTSDKTANQAELMASLMGLSDLWQANAGQTGLIHVVNTETMESVAVLRNGQTVEDMNSALVQAMSSGSGQG